MSNVHMGIVLSYLITLILLILFYGLMISLILINLNIIHWGTSQFYINILLSGLFFIPFSFYKKRK